jgi:GNAT superfamily N-acetyltransferase
MSFAGAQELEGEHMLGDGTRVCLRFIRPGDADELRRGFERLSPVSRYRRFLGAIGDLSDDNLRYLTNVDGYDHVAIVATRRRADGTEEGLGVARYIRVAGAPNIAEAAITVADDAQNKGLGRLLGLTLATAARQRGITHFRGEILADNESVRQLLREVGAELHATGDDGILFDVSLDRDSPTSPPTEIVIRRFLKAAATWIGGLIRHPRPLG